LYLSLATPSKKKKMKSVVMCVALVVVMVASVVLSEGGYGYRSHYNPGFKHVPEGVVSVYRNDARQHYVNSVAEHYGSGTGTARWVGVPGTNGYYGYGHGGHGHGGHGGY